MKTFTLSVQAMQNLNEWFRISSGLEVMSENVFITIFPVVLLHGHC